MSVPDTLHPLSSNIRLLGDILGETIAKFEGQKIFREATKLRRLAQRTRLGSTSARREIEKTLQSLNHTEKYKVAKAFSEFLRLANLCEQVHRIRRRKEYRKKNSTPQRASPLDTFTRLRKSGISEKAIKEAMRDIQIELVLTAHPTEAMMPQAVRAYRDLSVCLLKLDSDEYAPYEKELFIRDIRSIVTQMWLSGTVRDRKPTPVEEARYGLEFAEQILWHAVPGFHHLMSAAYKEAVGDMSDLYPRPVRFASWMGGDRDGHPGVTARVTRKVLQEASRTVTGLYLAALKPLRDIFSFDKTATSAPIRKFCTKEIDIIEKRLKSFRRDLSGFSRREFLDHLYKIQDFLIKHHADELARVPLQELIWRVRVFGLCFLKLDIRQSADVHSAALTEILGDKYAAADENEKVRMISSALRRPRVSPPRKLSSQGAEVLNTLRLYGELPHEFFGPCVISMASTVSDVLGVLLLLKAAGVTSSVPICPLFETPTSLKNACPVMESLYKMPLYKRHAGKEQQIMLGYSDSSKRDGYVSAAWKIYRLQSCLVRSGTKYGMQTTFFHGRGGTIARGGGPIETALLALPRPLATRRLRVTEQGEAINSKFGLPEMAERTMELYLSGFLEAILSKPEELKPAWIAAMDRLAENSASVFQKAVYGTPEFMPHYQQLTPTPELGLMKIGSRPGRRKKGGGLDSLRAIPWVFGWTQSRTLLPAWLGIVEAMDAEIKSGGLKNLQSMYNDWPFFQSVMDLIEMVIAKSDAQVTQYYSDLLVEPSLRWLTRDYLTRLEKTKKTLMKVMGRKQLLEKSPVLARSIRIRTPYVDVLNILQVHLLKEYRAKPSAALGKTLALTIGGISAGMRNTG